MVFHTHHFRYFSHRVTDPLFHWRPFFNLDLIHFVHTTKKTLYKKKLFDKNNITASRASNHDYDIE